ncbi:hypothetical protein [Bacillus thuringiensis]|uniref:hypothetical protein n=1 Tax=Bacillus thuringiensis TaxID=1428 RepID=UPI0021D65D39|nr:hypothetical protein [Bacillus thuringiensis]MCU7667215.1 hypothetical protein [Bacillus thuringiensis]
MEKSNVEEMKEKYKKEIGGVYIHLDQSVISFFLAETLVKFLNKEKEYLSNVFEKKALNDALKILNHKLTERKTMLFTKEVDGINNQEFKDSIKNVLEIISYAAAEQLGMPTNDVEFYRNRADALRMADELMIII